MSFSFDHTLPKRILTRQCFDLNFLSITPEKSVIFTKLYNAAPDDTNLLFSPITRAMCPPISLHDLIVRDWEYVRSYIIKDGHLFLSLMADGGIYKFEPVH
jgi:hypothetical protein